MFKQLMGMAALCIAMTHQIRAQDLVCGAIGIQGQGSTRTARIKIVNQRKNSATPLRVYIELHTNIESDNPIAQISYSSARLRAWRTRLINVNFENFTFRPGFNITHARKLVVICDPKNEVKETNEGNNQTARALVTPVPFLN